MPPATDRLPRLDCFWSRRLRTRWLRHTLHLRPFTFALRSLATGKVEMEMTRLVLLCSIGLVAIAESRKDAALLRLRLLFRLVVQPCPGDAPASTTAAERENGAHRASVWCRASAECQATGEYQGIGASGGQYSLGWESGRKYPA